MHILLSLFLEVFSGPGVGRKDYKLARHAIYHYVSCLMMKESLAQDLGGKREVYRLARHAINHLVSSPLLDPLFL